MNAKTPTVQHDHQTSQGQDRRALSPLAAAGPGENPLPPYTAVIDGKRLAQLRRQHGLSQEDLAYQARIGRTTLARLERQSRPRCRTHTLAQLAAALEENPESIAFLVRAAKTSPPRPGRAAITPAPVGS